MNKPSLTSQKTEGLGDKVERIAKPIAVGIDRVFGTNVKNCEACKRRRDWLNKHSK